MILHAGHLQQKAHSWFVGCARDRRQYREAWHAERDLKWDLAEKLTRRAAQLSVFKWVVFHMADTQSLLDVAAEVKRVAEWRESLTVFK